MSALGRQPSSTLSDTSLQTDEKHAHHGGATAQRAEMPIIFEDAELEGDEAAKALKGQTLDFTEADEARVLRKIDWRLMPVMAWACGLQFVDKAALGNAAVFGLRGDLGLVGTQYSWAISIFSFGYAVGAYPSLLAMQRLKMNQFLGVMTVLWGATLLGMLGVSNFAGLMVCRFLLGLCESCLAPGFVQLTGRFYRQQEQPWRFGLWTVANGLLPIPMLVCFYGLGHATGGALEPWRYIFLLLGLLTILTGVLIFIVLPDNPANTSWLSPRDQAIAVERVARSQTGIKNRDLKGYQVKEALTDIRVWLVVMTLFLSQSGGSITTNFLGILIQGFGYSQLRTQLLQTPAFAIQVVVSLLVTGLVTFTKFFRYAKQPLLSVAAGCVVAACAVTYTHYPSPENRHLLLGMMYMIAINNCSYTTILSVVSTNFAGASKKSAVNGMVFIAQCVSNIVVPFAFLARESPVYHTGVLTVMIFQIALIVIYWTSWTLMTWENKRRDTAAARNPEVLEAQQLRAKEIASGLKDMTDRENPAFRYAP